MDSSSNQFFILPKDEAAFWQCIKDEHAKRQQEGYVFPHDQKDVVKASLPKILRRLADCIVEKRAEEIRVAKKTVQKWASEFRALVNADFWSAETDRVLARERLRREQRQREEQERRKKLDAALPAFYVRARDHFEWVLSNTREPDPIEWNETTRKIVEERCSCAFPSLAEFIQEHKKLCHFDPMERKRWQDYLQVNLAKRWAVKCPKPKEFKHEVAGKIAMMEVNGHNEHVLDVWETRQTSLIRDELASRILEDKSPFLEDLPESSLPPDAAKGLYGISTSVYGLHFGQFVLNKWGEYTERLRTAQAIDLVPWGNPAERPFVSSKATNSKKKECLDIEFGNGGPCVPLPLWFISHKDPDGSLRKHVDELHRAFYPQCHVTPFSSPYKNPPLVLDKETLIKEIKALLRKEAARPKGSALPQAKSMVPLFIERRHKDGKPIPETFTWDFYHAFLNYLRKEGCAQIPPKDVKGQNRVSKWFRPYLAS